MVRPIQVVIILIILTFAINLVSAEETYQYGQDIDLKKAVRVDDGIATGIVCNISVYRSNNSIVVNYKPMTDQTQYFNYTILKENNLTRGVYRYEITCFAPSGYNKTYSSNFLINIGGINPSSERSEAIKSVFFLLMAMTALLFLAFLFTQKPPVKWTFFLLFFLFLLITVNIQFLSLQDEVVNPKLENFFSNFSAISFYMYWFIGALIAVIWMITFIVSIISRNISMKEAKYNG